MPQVKVIDFALHSAIPSGMASQLQNAVVDFINSSHAPSTIDKNGFYYQTLQAMANSCVLNGHGDLWLGIEEGELVAYVMGHIGNDFDGRLAYTVSQAWVRKDQRGQKWVREAWCKIRQRAKDCFCKHFVVLSTLERTQAYCRFLGKGFTKYAEILKEEI